MISCLILLACGACLSGLDDWPAFRGPTGDGRVASEPLPLQWNSVRNIDWKQELPGKGWSSPAIRDGQIYLTTAVTQATAGREELSLRLLILDVETGEMLRDVEVFREPLNEAPRIHDKNSHASPSPLIADGRIYVHFGHQGTACLDREGNILWTNRDLRYPPVHGNGGSPILVGSALIFSCDGGSDPFVVALHKDTGQVLWKTARDTDATKTFSFSTPTLITVAGQDQVISPGSNVVCAYDPANGRELWRVRYDGYSVIPKPLYVHGLVFVCTGYNQPHLLAIDPRGKGDLTSQIVWRVTRGAPHTPSLVVHGDELYMVSDRGVASCLNAKTGKVHWQERLGGNYSASPILAGDRIFFTDEAGKTTVVQAGTEFKVLATNDLQERTLASPAAVEQALFIRTQKHLYRIEDR